MFELWAAFYILIGIRIVAGIPPEEWFPMEDPMGLVAWPIFVVVWPLVALVILWGLIERRW